MGLRISRDVVIDWYGSSRASRNSYIVVKPTTDPARSQPHVLNLIKSLVKAQEAKEERKRERAVFYTTRFGKRHEHPLLHPARPRQAEARHFEAVENRLDKALITKALGLQMLTKENEASFPSNGEILCTQDGKNCFPVVKNT